MKNSSLRYIAGITVILIAFGLLVMGSMRSNTLRAMPVDQLMSEKGEAMVGQRLRLAGFVGSEPVTKTTLQTPQGTIEVKHFNVVYHDKVVAIQYQDALPDSFKPGSPVQVEGIYNATGEMQADLVLTKCPSKYQAEEAEKAQEGKKALSKEKAVSLKNKETQDEKATTEDTKASSAEKISSIAE